MPKRRSIDKACIGTTAVDVFNCDLNQSPWCVFGLKRKQPTKFLKCYPDPFAVSTGHLFSGETIGTVKSRAVARLG